MTDSPGAPGQVDAVPASLAGELLVYLMEAKPCGSEELGQLQEMAGVFAQWCRESCPHDARDALVVGLTNPARVYADSEVAEIAHGLTTTLGE